MTAQPSTLAALALGMLVLLTTACGSTSTTTSDSFAACALVVEYDGHTYRGTAVKIAPVTGHSLDQGAVPACRDTPDSADEPGRAIELAEVDGISPEIAVTQRGEHGTIFIRDDADYDRLPPELARLLTTPRCDVEPIELSGPWQGILGADGQTELDLEPPYDVTMYAAVSSAPSYERAYLTVRVPVELGRRLDRPDIESSLWKGGTISITARCDDGRFVATRIKAQPPD